MNRSIALIVGALCVMSPATGLTRAQTPAAASSLEGFVVDSVTGQPIEGVQVAITAGAQGMSEEGIRSLLDGQESAPKTSQITKVLPAWGLGRETLLPERAAHSVMTDSQGKFRLTAITAGKYMLVFRADGYNFQTYGQRSESSFASPLDIHEGKNDVGRIQMNPEPRIEGKIIDSAGGPIASIPVYLLTAQPFIRIDGDKQFRVESEALTDQTGRYSFEKASAGRFYIATGSSGRSEGITIRPTADGGTSTTPIAALVPYPYTYYPGVSEISLAGQIDATAGNKVVVPDMVVTKKELRSIRGRVIDDVTGKPPESVRVVLNGRFPFFSAQHAPQEIRVSPRYERATGAFEFTNLIPAHYRIDALMPRQQQTTPPAGPFVPGGLSPGSGFELVELIDADINDLVVHVPGRGRVTGKVVTADGMPLPVGERPLAFAFQLGLDALMPLQPAPIVTSVSVRDGSFEIAGSLEGKYRFGLAPLRDNYYISEFRLDGRRVTNGILDIPKNAVCELIITLSRGAEIRGVVIDRKGQPVKQVQGVILPDPLPEIIPFDLRIYADAAGNFTADGVPPGNHRIYVWDGIDAAQHFDRELLSRTRALAFPIRVDKGERISVSVPIIVRN